MIPMKGNNPVKNLVIWAVVMIVLETLYVFAEVAFNAGILNASAGLVLSRDEIENLEHIGRTLSGIGFSFVVFGFIRFKNTFIHLRVKVLAACLVICTPTMYFGQKFLIDELLINRASNDLLVKAEQIMILKRGYQTGTYSINSVGFEINEDKLDSPVEMSYLSMLGMLLLDSEKWEGIMDSQTNTFIKQTHEHMKGIGLDEAYSAYKQVSNETLNAWNAYNKASREFLANRAESMKDADINGLWNEAQKEVDDGWEEYQQARRDFRSEVAKNMEKRDFRDYLQSRFKRFNRCKTRKCQDDVEERMQRDIRKYTGVDKEIWYWCDSSRRCPEYSSALLNKMVTALVAKGDFKKRTRFSYYIHSKSDFMKEDRLVFDVRGELSRRGIIDPDIYTGTYSSFKKTIESHVYQKAANEWFQKSSDAYGLPPGLSKTEFYKTAMVQDGLKKIFAIEHYVDYQVKMGMTKSQFVYQYNNVVPAKKVQHEINSLVRDLDAPENIEIKQRYQDSLRAIIVPPIALFFSLFFFVFTVVRIPLRFLAISFYINPTPWKMKLKKVLLIADFVFVLSLPFIKPDNKLSSKAAVEETIDYFDSNISVFGGWAFEWYMNAEPVIYPIGNGLLNLLGISNIDHPDYVDEHNRRNRADADYEINKDEAIQKPVFYNLSRSDIREGQQILSKLGYEVGGIDGIAGNKTRYAAERYLIQIGYLKYDYHTGELDKESLKRKNDSYGPMYHTLVLMAK